MYLVFLSPKNDKILVTKNYNDAYPFIIKNRDTMIRILDSKCNTKRLDKRKFLMNYYTYTNEKHKMFEMAKFTIKGVTNLNGFLLKNGLMDDYRAYKQAKKAML